MNLNTYLRTIENWLKEKLESIKCDGYVLGVSGGIDSAVVALLAKNAINERLHCLILPCESADEDVTDAVALLDKNNISYTIIDLSSTYKTLCKSLSEKETISEAAMQNVKVRLRMVTMYAIGQSRNSLVLGTDNMDEYYTGYFTKYGDGGVDLLPIVHLTKGEVFEAAKLLGVDEKIIKRVPSAGLFANQSDEAELGITYKVLDDYLLGRKVSDEDEKRIIHLHNISNHKREPIPTPPTFLRD